MCCLLQNICLIYNFYLQRIIEDSSESSSGEDENKEAKPENPEKKLKFEANGVVKSVKKRVSVDENEQVSKKKKIDENGKKKAITVKDLLREKREEFNLSFDESELAAEVEKEPLKPPIFSNNTVNDVIESVVHAGLNDNVDETSKDSSSSEDVAAGKFSHEMQ